MPQRCDPAAPAHPHAVRRTAVPDANVPAPLVPWRKSSPGLEPPRVCDLRGSIWTTLSGTVTEEDRIIFEGNIPAHEVPRVCRFFNTAPWITRRLRLSS